LSGDALPFSLFRLVLIKKSIEGLFNHTYCFFFKPEITGQNSYFHWLKYLKVQSGNSVKGVMFYFLFFFFFFLLYDTHTHTHAQIQTYLYYMPLLNRKRIPPAATIPYEPKRKRKEVWYLRSTNEVFDNYE
jgi:hypothetical protein